jgi:hypothetical protein
LGAICRLTRFAARQPDYDERMKARLSFFSRFSRE